VGKLEVLSYPSKVVGKGRGGFRKGRDGEKATAATFLKRHRTTEGVRCLKENHRIGCYSKEKTKEFEDGIKG